MKSTDLSKLSGILLDHSQIKGTFSPDILFSYIYKDCGKVDYLAVFILSDIIYWHRLDKDGNKKYKGELLQKSYDDYALKFNAPKRTVKASFDLLVDLGFIFREFRTVSLRSGQKLANVMYISLNIKKLLEIFNDQDCDNCFKDVIALPDDEPINVSSTIEKSPHAVKNEKFEHTYYVKSDDVLQGNDIGHTKKCGTYTNTNSNNTKNIISFISQANRESRGDNEERMNEQQVRELLSENIDIEALTHEQPLSADSYREYLEIMIDLCCHNQRPMKIHGNTYSAEAIRNRIFKLRREHLEYVCEKYENYIGKITDYYAHVTATLYCSYFEVNNYLSNLRHRIEYENCI